MPEQHLAEAALAVLQAHSQHQSIEALVGCVQLVIGMPPQVFWAANDAVHLDDEWFEMVLELHPRDASVATVVSGLRMRLLKGRDE